MCNEIAYYKSPVGWVKIEATKKSIEHITIVETPDLESRETSSSEILKNCIHQLKEYFEGKRKRFTLPLEPKGTTFQLKVWQELLNIPYGKTISYLELSKKMGNVKAIRAIAAANGKNPLWIVIPCHRVIGSDGSLVGYAGGLDRKKWLLDHENPSKQLTIF